MRFAHDSSLCGGSLLGAASADAVGGVSSVMRFAHDCSFCGRSLGGPRLRTRYSVPAGTAKGLCDRPLETFARSPLQLCGSQRWQVAAALSAAVTTTKPIGDRPHLTGGTTYAEAHPPNAICSSGEGVWGRGASLREAASPPESPPHTSLREGARGRGLLFREAPSLAYICPFLTRPRLRPSWRWR